MIGGLGDPCAGATGRHRLAQPSNPLVSQPLNIINNHWNVDSHGRFIDKTSNRHSQQPPYFRVSRPFYRCISQPPALRSSQPLASKNRTIESSNHRFRRKVLIGGLGDPCAGATSCHRAANLLVSQPRNIIKNHLNIDSHGRFIDRTSP